MSPTPLIQRVSACYDAFTLYYCAWSLVYFVNYVDVGNFAHAAVMDMSVSVINTFLSHLHHHHHHHHHNGLAMAPLNQLTTECATTVCSNLETKLSEK